MLKKFKYKRYFISSLLTVYLLAFNQYVYALSEPSLGQAAENMLVPIGLFTEGFYKICYILGGTLILGAGIQYKNYRDNPSAVRLSTPVVLFLLGVSFILLPLIGMTSPGAEAARSSIN